MALSGFGVDDENIPTDTENRWNGQPRDSDGRFDKGSKSGKKFRISRKEKSSESPKKSDKGVEKSDKSGIIKAIEETGFQGDVHLSPKPLNLQSLTIDSSHINKRGHNVSLQEAKTFIEQAKISVSRWNGRYELYFCEDSATYVDTTNNIIRTAFKKNEFDETTQKVLEVLKKYGR